MNKSAKNPVLPAPTENECRVWLKDFTAKARGNLEELRVKHGIPPAEILEIVGMCKFSDLPAVAPELFRSARLREESATVIEKAADDLELWDRLSTPVYRIDVHSDPDFRDKLREKTKAIRLIGKQSMKHRPADVLLAECARWLTDTFRKRTGKPLYEQTGKLLEQAFNWHIADKRMGVKKLVKRAARPRLHSRRS